MEKEIEKLISDYIEENKLFIPWDGQYKSLAKKIIKIVKKKQKEKSQ